MTPAELVIGGRGRRRPHDADLLATALSATGFRPDGRYAVSLEHREDHRDDSMVMVPS